MGGLSDERARGLGLDALLWIAGDPDRAGRFMAASGSGIEDLRRGALDPEFLGFVLEYLTQGDDDLLAFCKDHHHSPEEVMAARQTLPGGALPNWT